MVIFCYATKLNANREMLKLKKLNLPIQVFRKIDI
jgi:hypothetical protein